MFILKLIVIGAIALGFMAILFAAVFSIVICIGIGVTDRKLTKKKYYNYSNIGQIKKEMEESEE